MLTEALMGEHRDCDELFASAESHAADGDAPAAQAAWREFRQALERHIALEEETLFPELEEATGMSDGPTAVMRMEHEQMLAQMERMHSALEDGDLDGFLDLGETLNILIQQHNMKEEQMLYPMCDQTLGSRAGEILAATRG